MIVCTASVEGTPQPELPYKKLAVTKAGDAAYFVDPVSFKHLLEESGVASTLGGTILDATPLLEDFARKKSKSGEAWLPNIHNNGRLTIFIAGNPGAGKSYLCKQLIELFPKDYDILLFTALDESDGNFDDLKDRINKVRMDPDNLMNITLPEIRLRSKHPVLLFDDIDKIRDKSVGSLTYSIMEDALANGRGHERHDGDGDVHVLMTSHSLNDFRKTKYSFENSDYVAVFPASTTFRQLKLLWEKMGLPMDLCAEVVKGSKNGEYRSVIIHKTTPMFIIMGNIIKLI